MQAVIKLRELVVNIFLGIGSRVEERNFQRNVVEFIKAVDNSVMRVIFIEFGLEFGSVLFAAQISIILAAVNAQNVFKVFACLQNFSCRFKTERTAENFFALVHDESPVFGKKQKFVAVLLKRFQQRKILPTAGRREDYIAAFEFSHCRVEAFGQFVFVREKSAVHIAKNYFNH